MTAVRARERALVVGGLLVLCGLAWLYLLDQARGMGAMGASGASEAWGLRELGSLAVMWSVMMAAMMLPSATPTVLLVDRMSRTRRQRKGAGRAGPRALMPLATIAFVLGYLLLWALYSLFAAAAQWLLHDALLVTPMMVGVSPLLSGTLLVVAGLYQLTPLKEACLARCRSPLSFVSTRWREGSAGALLMGMRHGTYCVGCCWALMTLLFVLGVMNLLWVLALAVLVMAEKTLPRARWVTRATSAALLGWGAWVLATGAG